MIVVSILEECVQVAVGRGGKRPVIKALYREPYDRLAQDGRGWEAAAAAFWRQHDLPRRGITLILPRQSAITKVMTLPVMGEKQTIEAIRWEMQGEEELVLDFLPLASDGKKRRILAAGCRCGVLDSYLDGFARLGLELGRISVPLESLLKLLPAFGEMKEQTCLWLLFDGGTVMSFLAERGAYCYCGSGRVFSPWGTAEFAAEVERIVSGTMQFHASGRPEDPITHVYYAGCTGAEFSSCLAPLKALGLTVLPLPPCWRISVPQGEQLGDWLYCAGSFLRI